MIITELQLTKLKGAFNTLLDLAESCQLQEYQREEYYFIGSGIESIIEEIEQKESIPYAPGTTVASS